MQSCDDSDFPTIRRNVRLAYKSSLESAKRDRQSSSERARSASERELDLFPLLEIESSDVILARTFQGAKLSNCQLNAFLSFQSFQRIFGNVDNCIGKLSQCVSKRWECFRTKPKYVENHLKIGPTHLQNIFKRWPRIWTVKRQVIFFISPAKRLYRTIHCSWEDFVYILMTAEIMSIHFAKIFIMLYFECASNNHNTGSCQRCYCNNKFFKKWKHYTAWHAECCLDGKTGKTT